MLVVPHVFGVCSEFGDKLLESGSVDELCVLENVNDYCSFVLVLKIVLHYLAADQLLERFTVRMMKDQYISRFRILLKQKIVLVINLSLRIGYPPVFYEIFNLILLDNSSFGNEFLQIDIDIFLHFTRQHQEMGIILPLSLRENGVNIHEIAVIVVTVHCDEFGGFTGDVAAAVVVIHPFLGLLSQIFLYFGVQIWQFGVVFELIEELKVGDAVATAGAFPIAVGNTHNFGSHFKAQFLQIVVDLSIAEDVDLIGGVGVGVFDPAAKEEKVGQSPQCFDAVGGEEEMGAVVEVDFVVLSVAEEGGEKVEDVLRAVEVDEEGGEAVEGAVRDQLHPDLHFIIIRIVYRMSIDLKYEAYLCDLLSLMQEALLRLLSQRAMDGNKFKHYFSSFYQKMEAIEQQFHEQRMKVTKQLCKLRDYCGGDSVRGEREEVKTGCDKPIQPPLVRYKSTNKNSQYSQQLKSIEEEEEEHGTQKRRSETAGGFRSKRNMVDHENGRPMTGEAAHRQRYQSRTINHDRTEYINTSASQGNKIDTVHYEENEQHGRRKSFYDELEKEKEREDPFPGREYKLPFRKRQQTKSQQKWSQKISRLL